MSEADPLAIPNFLRRNNRLSTEALYRILNADRDRAWAPIRDYSTKESVMAKIDQVIKNREASVTVHEHDKPDARRYFANMDEFERWYRGPSMARFLGANSFPHATDILLDTIRESAITRMEVNTKTRRGPKAQPTAEVAVPQRVRAAAPEDGTAARSAPKGTHHQVRVGNDVYRSTRAAFAALGLPDKEHQKFRLLLKREGKKVFTWPGKDYLFEIV